VTGADTISLPRRRRRVSTRPITLNLTPMIDVTFLLLVYFMVATQFKLGEEVYKLDLPDRQPSAIQRDPFELDDEPLRIVISTTASNRAQIRVLGPYPQPRDFAQLHDFLAQRRVSDGTTGGIFAEDHPIVIEATDVTIWEHTLEAFNAAARARYTNVTIGRSGGTS
jgi:biopolymer transport protein ExbD